MTKPKESETQLNTENNRGIKIEENNVMIPIVILQKLFAIVLIIIVLLIYGEYFADSDPSIYSIYFKTILAIISVIFS